MTPGDYKAWRNRQVQRFELWIRSYYGVEVEWEEYGVRCVNFQSHWDMWLYKPP
jgi:hypothetical protein